MPSQSTTTTNIEDLPQHDITSIPGLPSLKEDVRLQSTNTKPTTAPSQPTPQPSSSTAGFFQTPPTILPQLQDDLALRRALSLFLPAQTLSAITPDLTTFSAKVLSPQVQAWILDAERNPPSVKSHDTWGRRRDELITSTGWQSLQALGIQEGIVSIPYENQYAEYSRVYHAAKYALWVGSAAWVNCPSLMVDGVATLLRKHLSPSNAHTLSAEQESVFRSAYNRLTSRDPTFAWTTGQWMTERQGGSDVSMTETLATYSPDTTPSTLTSLATDSNPLGPWSISGFKWFSSATDANMTVLLARTQPDNRLSLFLAPMRRTLPTPDVLGNTTTLNGITIQRLKNKLGTRALPTAELELRDLRAWLVGTQSKGTKEIATVLNVARVHNGMSAIGFWGRGLSIVRAFTRVRVVGRKPLHHRPGYVRALASMHVRYHGDVMFNFFVAGLLGVVEQGEIAAFEGRGDGDGALGVVPGLTSMGMAAGLLRLLTPALKGHCSKTAIAGLQECMECMGGVGYLENDDMLYNIARLYRDANVLPIWEGTTDMMADDSIIRVLYGKSRDEVLEAVDAWIEEMLGLVRADARWEQQMGYMREQWMEVRNMVMSAEKSHAEGRARAMMEALVDVVQGLLLLVDTMREYDGVEGARLIAKSWFEEKMDGNKLDSRENWRVREAEDWKIVFGGDEVSGLRPKL